MKNLISSREELIGKTIEDFKFIDFDEYVHIKFTDGTYCLLRATEKRYGDHAIEFVESTHSVWDFIMR